MKLKKRKKLPSVKKRYDGEHKEKLVKYARKKYRDSKDDFELTNCLRSLEYFEEQAVDCPVYMYDKNLISVQPIFNNHEVADLLEKAYQTIWRWQTVEMIPRPVFFMATGRANPVYHKEEVRTLIEIIGEHEKTFAYYHRNHTDTRRRLFKTIETVRANLEKEISHGCDSQGQKPEQKSVNKRSKRKKRTILRS